MKDLLEIRFLHDTFLILNSEEFQKTKRSGDTVIQNRNRKQTSSFLKPIKALEVIYD